jgi:hypothetical protein
MAEIFLSARVEGNIERRPKMIRNKILSLVLAVALFAALPAGIALAAKSGSTLGSGTLLSISLDSDPVTKITTGLVTLLDETGMVQKITVSLESAVTMELVLPNPEMIGKDLVILDPVDPTIVVASGTVKTIAFVTDPVNKITSVDVTLTDSALVDQTVNMDLEKAIALGLIATDPVKVGTPVVIDPTLILDSTTYVKGVNTLESFFGTTLGVSTDELAAYKADGFGFGEIAQAAWMATNLGGDATLLDQILTAKQTGDFSTIVLPDGKVVTNWGQLRKAVLTDPHQNLGQIMSGHADPLVVAPPAALPADPLMMQGNGHGHGNGNSHGNGHGNGK